MPSTPESSGSNVSNTTAQITNGLTALTQAHYTSPNNDAVPVILHTADGIGGSNANKNSLADNPVGKNITKGGSPLAANVISTGYAQPAAVQNLKIAADANGKGVIFSNPA